MTNNTKDNIFVLGLLAIFFALGIWFGYGLGKYQTQLSAIRAGVGEFYLPNPTSQTSDFHWKTNITANLK